MYTNETTAVDCAGLLTDVRYLQANHGPAMDKLNRMKHASLVHRLNDGGKSWKRRLMLAANCFPKKASFPYGEQAVS